MRGDLSETNVADLCRGLSAAGATGAVEVADHAGDARIFFRAGDVYWAVSPTPRARLGDRLVNSGLLSQEELDEALEAQRASTDRTKLGALLVERGLVSRDAIRVFVQEQILDALFEMMQWHTGAYVFNPGEVADEKLPIDIPVDQLLVEVSRRQSEWDQIKEAIPDLDMVPDFVTGGSSANAALEPDEFTVLANVDGGRSIRDLADDLGYSEFEAARIVYGLTLLGIVQVRPVEDDETADLPGGTAGGDATAGPVDLEAGSVDVASALEEAIAGSAVGPVPDDVDAAPRPRVKLHVDDDVRDYLPPHGAPPADGTEDGPASIEDEAELAAIEDASDPAEDEEPVTREPAPPAPPEVRVPAAGERSVADLTAALTAALDDEPEPWVAAEADAAGADDAGADDAGDDDVAPAVPVADDGGFFAGPPPAAADPALDDDDFDALLSELEGPADAPAGAASEDRPAEDGGAPRSVPDGPPPAQEDPPPAAEPAAPRRAAGSGGDVSEFLRELSQLATDDPPPSANPGPTRPPADRPSAGDDDAPADPAPTREEDRRQAAERRDDRNKKRGLFGWGR